MQDWLQSVYGNLGKMYAPNYGSLDPQAQQQASQNAMFQLGVGMLDNSTKNPAQAFGSSARGLQQAGTQAMQAQAMAETMNDRRDERRRQQGINNAWGQYAQKFAPKVGIDAETLTAFGPQLGMQILAESNKGTGRWMSGPEKAAQGIPENQPIWIGADGTPKGVGGGGTNVQVDIGDGKSGWSQNVLKRYDNISSAADSAGSTLATVQNFRSLLDAGIPTGANEAWKMEVKRRLGIDLGQVAGQEAITALSNKMIGPLVKQLGTNPTDRDLQFMVGANPGLDKTPGGNMLLLDTLEIQAKRAQVLQQLASEYVAQARQGGMDAIDARLGLDNEIRKLTQSHPLWTEAPKQLEERMKKIVGTSGRNDRLPQKPENIPQWEWDSMSDEDKALW